MASEEEEKEEQEKEEKDEDDKEKEEEKEKEKEEMRERKRKKKAVQIEKLTNTGHNALKHSQLQDALRFFRQALKIASQMGESRVVSACCFNLGAALVEAGDPESGLAYLNRAQPGPKSQRLPDLQFNVALAYNALGQRQKAVAHFLQAAQLYSSQGNGREEGDACCEMSRCHALDQEYTLAAHGFLRAADSYRVANQTHSAAVALKEAAGHMAQSDEFSPTDVTKVLTECLSLTDKITDQSILGELYLSVGVVFCQMRSFQEAVQCFQKALSSASQQQQRLLLAKVLLNLGAALNAAGEFRAALEYHRLAARLYGTLGCRGEQAQCFSNLALACRHLGNEEEAIESFNHALQGFTDSEEHSAQIQVCESLADVYLKQRKQHKAIQLYRLALLSLSHCQVQLAIPGLNQDCGLWQDSGGVGDRLVERLTVALRQSLSVTSQRPRPLRPIRLHPLSPPVRRYDITPSPSRASNQQTNGQRGEDLRQAATVHSGLAASPEYAALNREKTSQASPGHTLSELWSDRELHTDSETSLAQKAEAPPTSTPNSRQATPLLDRIRSRFCSLM